MVNNVDTVDPREVQMLQEYLNEFGQQIEAISRQLQAIEQRRIESIAAMETLKALQGGRDDVVLLQLGGGASLRVKIIDPAQVLLNIGSDVIVERQNADAVDFLEGRVKEMEALEKKLTESIEQVQKQANEVARRIEAAYQKAEAARAGL